MISRRTLFIAAGGMWLVSPLATRAQQTGRVYRVAVIVTTTPVSKLVGPDPIHPGAKAFLHTLRDLGYAEGRNLSVEWRSAEGKAERYASIVREVVHLGVDVIVTVANEMTRRAKEVTTTIPIVMLSSSDPVGIGLVQSLARPGGNVTGLTVDTGPEFQAKRMELLKEAVPDMRRVAILASRFLFEGPWGPAIGTAADTLGVAVIRAETTDRASYSDAFALINREKPDALYFGANPQNYEYRPLIVNFATHNRLPTIFDNREGVEAGGLMSYGVNFSDLWARAAICIDKILQGAKPADLPIERPSKFELVINLRTAKALGLTIPALLLARADEVIE